jgi:hypothetical protein
MPKKRLPRDPSIPRAEEERLIAEAEQRVRKIPPASEIAEIFTYAKAKEIAVEKTAVPGFTQAEIEYRVKKVL